MGTLSDIKDRTPNPRLVAVIEQLLAEAQSGEIRTLVYVVGFDDDGTGQGWAIDERTSYKPVLGELTMLAHEYATNIGLRDGDSVLCHALEGEI